MKSTHLILAAVCAALAAGCKTAPPPAKGAAQAAAPVKKGAIPAPAEISSNRYVICAPDGSCKITIDTTKALDMTDWAEHRLAPVLAEWYPKMCAMMRTPGFTPPTNWTVTIAPGNGVAATGGTRITANYPWFKTQMDKTGPFSANEIKNLSAIVERLRKQSDPISSYLWKELSNQEKLELVKYQPSASSASAAQEIVLEAFNKILEEPCIYTSARFKGIPLTYETQALLHQSPKDIELSHPNRLLLQDAYAQDLTRSHKEGIGALVHEEMHVVQQYGSARRLNPAGNFGLGDITNFPVLVKKLQDQADPVSAYVNLMMTSAERKALAKYQGPGPTDYTTRTNLLSALNRIMRGPCLYDAALFKGVTLRDTTVSLRDQKPEDLEVVKLNRALLEDAYPGQLIPSAGTSRGRGGNTGWLTEGIPDYIRWFIYQPEAHGADLVYFKNKADPKYDGAYRPSAYFLNYVTHKYDPQIVTKLNDACRTGKYYEAIWYDNTGKTLPQLNTEWLDMFHKGKT
jgi:hypothetical protein